MPLDEYCSTYKAEIRDGDVILRDPWGGECTAEPGRTDYNGRSVSFGVYSLMQRIHRLERQVARLEARLLEIPV